MTPNIDTLTAAPQIGKYYMVPTVRYECCGLVSDWPVFGPKHEDAEIIDFPHQHYHHDSRFMSQAQYKRVAEHTSRPEHVNLVAIPIHRLESVNATNWCTGFDKSAPHPPLIYKRLRCKREMHKFVEPGVDIKAGGWPEELRKHHAKDCLRRTESGMLCPHRGARLDTLDVSDGVVTCPLHGLKWSLETGKAAL